MYFYILIKTLHLSGGDHIHFGIIVDKFEGKKDVTLSFVNLLRVDFIEKDRNRGIYFTQHWVSLSSVLPIVSGVFTFGIYQVALETGV